MKTRIDFSAGGKKYYITKPTQEQVADAEFVYKTTFSDALRAGALTHNEAQRIIKERNLFTNEEAQRQGELLVKIGELGEKLSKTDSVKEGLDLVSEMQAARQEIMIINRRRNSVLDNTAESYADEQRLHHYIVTTTYDASTGELAFKNRNDLLSRSDEPVAIEATRYVIYMVANNGEDFRSEWPDLKWQMEHGLVDESGNPLEEIPEEFKKKLEAEDSGTKTATKKKTAKKKTNKKKATKKKTTRK